MGDIVVRQPSEREIYRKQIEPREHSCLLRYGSVNEYIYRKQYWEANDLDNIRLEEYEMHIYDKREKASLKWKEGTDGAAELEKMPRGCKYRIFQGMQKYTAPGATMNKTNENKMFPQGKAAVGKG